MKKSKAAVSRPKNSYKIVEVYGRIAKTRVIIHMKKFIISKLFFDILYQGALTIIT